MLSVNTNLSSLIAQSSLNNSTNALNIAIERMSTGYKLNHAKDNAANYSISTSIDTKLGAYNVAANNVAMGMDLVTTADGILNNMLDKASRLQALCVQARNGTYGAQSLSAINSEVSALVSEIMRVYNTAEYNNISLFGRKEYEIDPSLPKAGSSGFIDESTITEPLTAKYNGFIAEVIEETPQVIVTNPDDLKTAIQSNSKIGIANASTLQKLADLVNDEGIDCSGKTIILTEDIDLSSISNWRPIGNSTTSFKGTFNGNGHTIKNLTINRPTESFVGLFGYSGAGSAFKNVCIEGCNVKGNTDTGGLAGFCSAGIDNCYIAGEVVGTTYTGGLVGRTQSSIKNSYATGVVNGASQVGGVVGRGEGSINNCYSINNISGSSFVGGLVGYSYNSSITNSYATGNVTGQDRTGGLAGAAGTMTNCYATGNVTGQVRTGGLAGDAGTMTNCYATGNVAGQDNTGGLVGFTFYNIYNSYATGEVIGRTYTGGLVGQVNGPCIINSYAIGDVTGQGQVGGLVGRATSLDCSNSVAYGNVTGSNIIASFIGSYNDATSLYITNCQAKEQGMDKIGGCTDDALLANITDVEAQNVVTSLQVGINDDSTSQIEFDTNFTFDLSALTADITSDRALDCITDFIDLLSDKSTELGAIGNRLESALDSISVNIENLASSRSTIKDADIAKVSSQYIQQQILQQASATLLSTANQAPSIALQLI